MAVAVTEDIDCALADLWALVGNFGELQRWHPDVRSCVSVGAGAGAIRTVSFEHDTVEERLERLDPESHSIEYAIIGGTRVKMIGLRAAITLTALGPRTTRMTWTAGTQDSHPYASELDTTLKALYPARIQHLRAAAGLPPHDVDV